MSANRAPINQCIFFGAPTDELRSRYLKQYLKPYESSKVDIEQCVKQTVGVSQAFLKEYVFRAVQVAMEKTDYKIEDKACLENQHFEDAFDEMVEKNEHMIQSIVGFKVKS